MLANSFSKVHLVNSRSALLTYDAVSFVKYLDTIVAAQSPPPGANKHSHSPWLFLDATHVLFQTARARVYEGKLGNDVAQSSTLHADLKPVLEPLPKWNVLSEILAEIEHDVYLHPANADDSHGTILIMCSDQRTCRQLREFVGNMHVKIGPTSESKDEDDDSTLSLIHIRS